MAAGILPNPGSPWLCKGHCNHKSCNQIRRDAASLCVICGNSIGFDRPFYRDTTPEGYETGSSVHARCQTELIERQAKARLEKSLAAVRDVAAKYHFE